MAIEYSLDEKFTPRDLTPEEKTFLNALSGYTMTLDHSLFFQFYMWMPLKNVQRTIRTTRCS